MIKSPLSCHIKFVAPHTHTHTHPLLLCRCARFLLRSYCKILPSSSCISFCLFCVFNLFISFIIRFCLPLKKYSSAPSRPINTTTFMGTCPQLDWKNLTELILLIRTLCDCLARLMTERYPWYVEFAW